MSKQFKCNPTYNEDDLIFKAVESAKCFYDMSDANRYFKSLCEQNSSFWHTDSNLYRYKDYFINIGKRFTMAGHADCVMSLARLGLSCLPEGVASIWLDNGEDMVLITRIKGSEGHGLVPYSAVHQVSEKAKQRLLADVECLMDENYALLAVTEDKDAWNILEADNSVVFSRCELAFLSDAAKPAYLRRVMEVLGLIE